VVNFSDFLPVPAAMIEEDKATGEKNIVLVDIGTHDEVY